MALKFKLTTFTPAEAAEETGASLALQRGWRRDAYLPPAPAGRHPRYDVFQLAEIWAFKMLSDRGIGPAQTATNIAWLARSAVIHALQEKEAWGLDLRPAFKVPSRGKPGEIGATTTWERLALYLTYELMVTQLKKPDNGRELAYHNMRLRFWIWWGGGDASLTDDLSAEFENRLGKTLRGDVGAAVVVDLRSWAQSMLGKVRRPLVTVSESDK